MPNSISVIDWKQSEITDKDVFYGYSHKSECYFPYHQITDILKVGKTGRIGVKGFAENGDKLYVQLYKEHINKAIEKGWIKLPENENIE